MPVSTTLASQELLRPSPKSCSPCDIFSADEGGIGAPQGIHTAAFSAGPVHGSPATPSGRQRRGALTSGSCLYIRVLGQTLTAWSPMGEETSKALGSGLSLYILW
jgi:hypothetical protein